MLILFDSHLHTVLVWIWFHWATVIVSGGIFTAFQEELWTQSENSISQGSLSVKCWSNPVQSTLTPLFPYWRAFTVRISCWVIFRKRLGLCKPVCYLFCVFEYYLCFVAHCFVLLLRYQGNMKEHAKSEWSNCLTVIVVFNRSPWWQKSTNDVLTF